MTFYKKGANFERSLVKEFWKRGYASLRVAGSGSAPLSLPDIVAMKNGRIIAVECKTCSKESFYLKNSDIDELQEFSEVAGAEPFVAVKFNNVKPKFIPLALLRGKKISRNDTSLTLDSVLGVQQTL